jgi:hypothetical protein
MSDKLQFVLLFERIPASDHDKLKFVGHSITAGATVYRDS